MKYLQLLLVFILVSCAAKEEETSPVTISFTSAATGSAIMKGGVLVMGTRTDEIGEYFHLALADENQTSTVSLELGTWEFAAVAWDGTGSSTKKMEGAVKCGLATQTLGVGENNVSFNLSASNCANSFFGDATSKETYGGLANQPMRLQISNCNEVKAMGFPIDTALCNNDELRGTIKSVQVKIKSNVASFSTASTDSVGSLLPDTLTSQCISGFSGAFQLTDLRLPFFLSASPLIEVVAYPQAGCVGNTQSYHFNYGMNFDNSYTAKFEHDDSGLENNLLLISDICSSFDAANDYATGDSNDEFNYICTADHFNQMATDISGGLVSEGATFVIRDDIDFTGVTVNTIGGSSNSFKHILDGNHHTLSNITVPAPACSPTEPYGLFYTVQPAMSDEVEISDITFDNLTISSSDPDCESVGLIGKLHLSDALEVSLKNVHIKNSSITGENKVGGLIGEYTINAGTSTGQCGEGSNSGCRLNLYETSVQNTTITGLDFVGGLVGTFSTSMGNSDNNASHSIYITQSEFSGNVYGKYSVGGIIGSSRYAYIENAHSFGQGGNLIKMNDNTGNSGKIGGIAGYLKKSEIRKVSSIGSITPDSSYISDYYGKIGGIVGHTEDSYIKIARSNNDIIANGMEHGGIVGFFDSITYDKSINYAHAYGDVIDSIAYNSGNSYYGGIAGTLKGEIKYSFHKNGLIRGKSYIGGIVGMVDAHTTIGSNYSTVSKAFTSGATIKGYEDVGGLVGLHHGKLEYSISDSTVVLENNASSYFRVGALVGKLMRAGATAYTSTINEVASKNDLSNSTTSGTATNISNGIGLYVSILGTDVFISKTYTNSSTTETVALTSLCAAGQADCTNVFDDTSKRMFIDLDIDDYYDTNGELPFSISVATAAEFNDIADTKLLMPLEIELTDDIDFLSGNLTPIGSLSSPFIGNFIANGHELSSFNIPSSANDRGIFAVVGDSANGYEGVIGHERDPLKVSDATVSGAVRVGTVVGNLQAGRVSAHVYDSTVTATAAGSDIGGVIGRAENLNGGLRIINSSFQGSVDRSSFSVNGVGGIIGYLDNGEVEFVRFKGDIKGTNDVGGIVGMMKSGIISNAHVKYDNVTDNIKGGHRVGGAVGHIDFASNCSSGSCNFGNVLKNIGVEIDVLSYSTLGQQVGGVFGRVDLASDNNDTLDIKRVYFKNANATSAAYGAAGIGNRPNTSVGTVNVSNSYVYNATITGNSNSKNIGYGFDSVNNCFYQNVILPTGTANGTSSTDITGDAVSNSWAIPGEWIDNGTDTPELSWIHNDYEHD